MKSHEDLHLPSSSKYDIDVHHDVVYFFVSEEGIQYPFIFRNASNGYYQGYVTYEWKDNKPVGFKSVVKGSKNYHNRFLFYDDYDDFPENCPVYLYQLSFLSLLAYQDLENLITQYRISSNMLYLMIHTFMDKSIQSKR